MTKQTPNGNERLNKQTILWNMVTLYIFPYENYARDSDVTKVAEQIIKETKRDSDLGILNYSDLLVYTENIEFNWHEDAPEEYRALETWWGMVNSGVSEGECYLFFIQSIHNIIAEQWMSAKRDAQKIWRPPEQKADAELTDKEQADPNLESAASNLKTA